MEIPFFKKSLYFLEAIFFQGIYGFFWLMPLSVASFFGGMFLRFFGPLTPLNNKALKNLRYAFPEKAEEDLKRIVGDMWENLGRTLGEFPHIHAFFSCPHALTFEGLEHIDYLRQDDRPGLFFAAHLANWELNVSGALYSHLPILLVYRAANNPYIDAFIQRHREKAALVSYAPKGKIGARETLRVLKEGGNVGMLIDQRMSDGMALLFFGHKAWTASAFAHFSYKFKAPIVGCQVIRLKGPSFKIVYEAPFFVEETGDSEKDIEACMQKINLTLERWIRENPGQWLWLHNRWK